MKTRFRTPAALPAAAVLLCAVASSLRAQATNEPALKLEQPPPAVEAWNTFHRAVTDADTFSAEQKQAVERMHGQVAEDPFLALDQVPLALCRLYPAYQQAAVALVDQEPDAAETLLRRQLESKPLDPYVRAHLRLDLSRLLTFAERYEDALPVLEALAREDLVRLANGAEVLFMLATCQYRLFNRDAARTYLEDLLAWYGPRPDGVERYVMAAQQVLNDLASFPAGSLGDVFERMRDSRRRLALRETGEPVQEQQRQIIELLDRIIELDDMQQQQQQHSPQQGDSQQQQQQQSQGSQQQGQSQTPGQGSQTNPDPSVPATDSTLRGGMSGTEAQGDIARGDPGNDWRRLPERERDKVLDAVKNRYPERYKDLVEQYYRSLQEGGSSR